MEPTSKQHAGLSPLAKGVLGGGALLLVLCGGGFWFVMRSTGLFYDDVEEDINRAQERSEEAVKIQRREAKRAERKGKKGRKGKRGKRKWKRKRKQ